MFSVYPFPLWWLREYTLCLVIIIIKLEVWTIIRCIGLYHETMVGGVYLSIYFIDVIVLCTYYAATLLSGLQELWVRAKHDNLISADLRYCSKPWTITVQMNTIYPQYKWKRHNESSILRWKKAWFTTCKMLPVAAQQDFAPDSSYVLTPIVVNEAQNLFVIMHTKSVDMAADLHLIFRTGRTWHKEQLYHGWLHSSRDLRPQSASCLQ